MLSVCIPSLNRSESVTRLVRSISSANESVGGVDLEVVVILDGSTDSSAESLERISGSLGIPLTVVWQENRGLAAARNAAVHVASGDLVWFLDDDMIVTAEALIRHHSWDRSAFPVLTGPCHVIGDEGVHYFYHQRWERLRRSGCVEDADSMSFANTSAPRSVFVQHPFDERFRGYGFEDIELAGRLLRDGMVIAYRDDCAVTHIYERSRLAGLRNSQEEGIARVLYAQLHPELGRSALEVPPRHFARAIFLVGAIGGPRPLWWLARCASRISTLLPTRLSKAANASSHELALHSGLCRGQRAQSIHSPHGFRRTGSAT